MAALPPGHCQEMPLETARHASPTSSQNATVVLSLDPSKDGGMIDHDAAVLQHELEIAAADREHQIPAHRPEDHLGSELPALDPLTLNHPPPSSIDPALIVPLLGHPQTPATEPAVARRADLPLRAGR